MITYGLTPLERTRLILRGVMGYQKTHGAEESPYKNKHYHRDYQRRLRERKFAAKLHAAQTK